VGFQRITPTKATANNNQSHNMKNEVNKNTQPPKSETDKPMVKGRMLRLGYSIKSLGFSNGFRYWKIENAMMRDPDRALVWALDIEAESILEGLRGNLQSSQDLMKFAAEVRKAHSEYILANTEN